MTYVSVFGKGAISVLSGACLLAGTAAAKPMVVTLMPDLSMAIEVPDQCEIRAGQGPAWATCSYGIVEEGGTREINLVIGVSPLDTELLHFGISFVNFSTSPHDYLQHMMQAGQKQRAEYHPGNVVIAATTRQAAKANPAGFEACTLFDFDFNATSLDDVPIRMDSTGLHCGHYDAATQVIVFAKVTYANHHSGIGSRSAHFATDSGQVIRSVRVQ